MFIKRKHSCAMVDIAYSIGTNCSCFDLFQQQKWWRWYYQIKANSLDHGKRSLNNNNHPFERVNAAWSHWVKVYMVPDSKVHVAHMGSTWAVSAPGGPHVGPMNLAIRDIRGRRQFTNRPYLTNPTIHHFVREICTHVHISVIKL